MYSTIVNIFGLFSDTGKVDVEKTREFLDLSRSELAKAFGLTADQIRADRMSIKTEQRVTELAAAIEFVGETFEGDKEKTVFWLNTPNPNFGGSSPKQLIVAGRYNKLLKFIIAAKQGY